MEGMIYDRQASLELSLPTTPCVVGCGGVGTWVGIFLAMSGVKNLFLYDFDTLEIHNFNRLPFCQASNGAPKVDVLKGFIQMLRPDCNVFAVNSKLEGILLEVQMKVSDVFFECTDSYRSQLTVYKACVEHGICFIRAGYDGTKVMVANSVPEWGMDDGQGYTVTPSWSVPAAIAGALAVGKALKFHMNEPCFDLMGIGAKPVVRRRRRV